MKNTLTIFSLLLVTRLEITITNTSFLEVEDNF